MSSTLEPTRTFGNATLALEVLTRKNQSCIQRMEELSFMGVCHKLKTESSPTHPTASSDFCMLDNSVESIYVTTLESPCLWRQVSVAVRHELKAL